MIDLRRDESPHGGNFARRNQHVPCHRRRAGNRHCATGRFPASSPPWAARSHRVGATPANFSPFRCNQPVGNDRSQYGTTFPCCADAPLQCAGSRGVHGLFDRNSRCGPPRAARRCELCEGRLHTVAARGEIHRRNSGHRGVAQPGGGALAPHKAVRGGKRRNSRAEGYTSGNRSNVRPNPDHGKTQ